MNKVIIIGRLTKDPEVKKTQSGLSVCSFTIACDRKFKDQNGQKQTDFISCVAWRSQADVIGQYFFKGSRIGIVGNIQTRSYQDQNGQNRNVTEIMVEEIDFIDSKKKEEDNFETRPVPPMPTPNEPEEEDPALPFDIDF